MPRKPKYRDVVVDIPVNVSVDPNGYVYYNITSTVKRDNDGKKKYNDHKKVIIGKAISEPRQWQVDRKMTPNDNYYSVFSTSGQDTKPQRPVHDKSLVVGLHVALDALAKECGLLDDLYDAFGEEDSQTLLDFAHYMLSERSAVAQHVPSWGRKHATFEYEVPKDDEICRFLKSRIDVSEIKYFKSLWALRNISDGHVYFCYDSTNENSQAKGISLVEKGHAKDDPSLEQVNTDYVVRQDDGLPISFCEFPGSVNDMKEAKEMIAFLRELLEYASSHKKVDADSIVDLFITLICDRGYISQENVEELDDAGIGFILMLRGNMGITEKLITEHVFDVKKPRNYIRDRDQYVLVVPGPLFENDKRTRYFYIIWDSKAERDNRLKTYDKIERYEKELHKLVERKTLVTQLELKKYYEYFDVVTVNDGTVETRKRGRGIGTTETESFRVVSYQRNEDKMEFELLKCGYHVVVSSSELSAEELLMRYSKRDCVEKVFSALKSHLGMDELGVHSDEALHSKSMAWFIASIIYCVMQNKSESLRKKNSKIYTTPCIIKTLEEITADMNILKGEYERSYAYTAHQETILSAFGIKTETIDNYIKTLRQ